MPLICVLKCSSVILDLADTRIVVVGLGGGWGVKQDWGGTCSLKGDRDTLVDLFPLRNMKGEIKYHFCPWQHVHVLGGKLLPLHYSQNG